MSFFKTNRIKDLVEAVRKDIRQLTTQATQSAKTYVMPESFTLRSPTLNKHNHCSPQRHTIFLVDFLLSSWSQSAKTYDLLKHLLSDLLHVTSTTIAVRKDIQYCFYIFPCFRGRVIYSARNNRCHDPTAPNTAPVTQKDSHT